MSTFDPASAVALEPRRRFAHKVRNWIHTWALLGTSLAILALVAWSLAGPEGIVWVVVAGGVALWSVSRMTPEVILKLYRARPLPNHAFSDGNQIVATLAERAGLTAAPRLFYVPSRLMNAFAVGRPDHSAIAISDGLIRGLNRRQFAGVMAHEISHIASGDVRVMALADMVARMTGTMSFVGFVMLAFFAPSILGGDGVPWLGIVVLIFAPHLTNLLQLALSRAREYDADLAAVDLTGDPEGLASALNALERQQGAMWERLMLPGGGRIPDPSLLRTHPRTRDRVARLLSLRRHASPSRDGFGTDSIPPPATAGSVPVVGAPRFHRTSVWY